MVNYFAGMRRCWSPSVALFHRTLKLPTLNHSFAFSKSSLSSEASHHDKNAAHLSPEILLADANRQKTLDELKEHASFR
jgi:hypothetical protein